MVDGWIDRDALSCFILEHTTSRYTDTHARTQTPRRRRRPVGFNFVWSIFWVAFIFRPGWLVGWLELTLHPNRGGKVKQQTGASSPVSLEPPQTNMPPPAVVEPTTNQPPTTDHQPKQHQPQRPTNQPTTQPPNQPTSSANARATKDLAVGCGNAHRPLIVHSVSTSCPLVVHSLSTNPLRVHSTVQAVVYQVIERQLL